MESIVLVAAETDTSGIADWLWTRLKGAGFKVWWGEYDLRVGTVVAAGLEHAIEEHTSILLLINRETIESRWTEFQSDLALSVRKRIVPIVIDDSVWPTRFKTRRAMAMRGPNDWQSLHRLVNDLGGASIPRVVNLSGWTSLHVQGLLLLDHLSFPKVTQDDPASLIQTAIDLGRRVMPYFAWEPTVDTAIVPPGYAPLSVALLAYLAGSINQFPCLFWSYPLPNGQHQISAGISVSLQQEVRAVGIADRLAAPVGNGE